MKMKFSWFKRTRPVNDQEQYDRTLRELIDARHKQHPADHTLEEFIKIGNRDVGLVEQPEQELEEQLQPLTERPVVPDPDSVPVEASAPVKPAVDESLSQMSMEELARLLAPSDSDEP